MTSRERLLATLAGELPDCVPCCPDISNMIPAKMTGKPFWDIYLHQDPPLWKAYIDEAGRDGGFILSTGDQTPRDTPFENICAMVETARDYGRYS